MTQWESVWPLWKRWKQDIWNNYISTHVDSAPLISVNCIYTSTWCLPIYVTWRVSCQTAGPAKVTLLPLKFASRFFLCCGLKWREMVVVFSHFPSWSPAPTSNVNVLTVATRNKTVIKNMTLNSSTLRNLNNFQRVLWPVMLQEVRKSHFITRAHDNTSPMWLERTVALCCCGLESQVKEL